MNPEEAPECLFLAGEVDDTRHPQSFLCGPNARQRHSTAAIFNG
jgi:hypothetical protein